MITILLATILGLDGARPLQRHVLGPGVDLALDAALVESLAEPTKTWRATRRAAARLDAASNEETDGLRRFQTWYGRDEILAMVDWRVRHPDADIDAALQFLMDRGAAAARQDPAAAAALAAGARADAEIRNGLAGLTRVVFSPFLTRALLAGAERIADCLDALEAGQAPPEPCLDVPADPRAAVAKLRWMPTGQMFPVYSAELTETFAQYLEGTWRPGAWLPAMPPPTEGDDVLRLRLPSGETFGLVARHLAVKAGPDWHWQSTWLGGRTCAVPGFSFAASDEPDPFYDALTRDRGDRSWCSNPYMETEARAARTNCVGCHQHAGAELDPTAILFRPDLFPDDASSRMTPGAFDHLWSLTAGGQLAYGMRAVIRRRAAPAPSD